MSDYRHIFASIFKRGLIAAPFLIFGFYMMFRAGGGPAQIFATVLLGCGGLILGAVIIAFPLAGLFAEPSGNLYYPMKHIARPQPIYSIPESKRAKGEYEEAIAGFEQIAESFPQELKPYVAMIDIAIVDLKNPERAGEIFKRGITALKKDADRRALWRMYTAIGSRLNSEA